MQNGLLRSTLHSFGALWNAIFVLIVYSCCSVSSCLIARIDIFQIMFLRHGVSRGQDLTRSWWEDLFEEADVAQFCLVWEFHVELDVQVAEVVMSVRGHALTFDNLDRAYMLLVSIPKMFLKRVRLPGVIGSPGKMLTVNHRSSRCSM